jgi:hypothetical protein
MTIMKKQILLMALAACCFASCKKDNGSKTNTPSPEGFWTGKYGAAATLSLNYAVLLKSDGTMRSYVMSADKTDTATATAKGSGTWKQEELVITTEYIAGGYTFNTSATTDQAITTMTGTWSSNSAFAGGFVLTKQ